MTSFILNWIPDRWPGQQQAVRIILRYWFPPASATT
jgi:hypothetical protein